MINPFISNNQQLLFRKNAQVLNRPPIQSPPPLQDTSLSRLQTRNPFSSHSPRLPLRTSLASPQRPSSLSRSNVSSSVQQYFPRGGILESTDGWKKQMQSRQRQRLQLYGAQGLRYNAYQVEEPQKIKQNYQNQEYYQIVKHTQPKGVPSKFEKYDSASNYYLSPRENYLSPRENILPVKNRKQMFRDEVQEAQESPNFNLVDPRRESGSVVSNQSRHSKINDMFESHFEDRTKRSMHYASYYGGGHEQMIESKKSKFKESVVYNPSVLGNMGGTDRIGIARTSSMESSVHKVEVVPNSITLWGTIYKRIPL